RAGSGGSIVRLIVPGAEVPIDVSSLEIDVDPASRGHLRRLPIRELDIVGQDAEVENLNLAAGRRGETGRRDDVVPDFPLTPVVADILRRHRLELGRLAGPVAGDRRLDREVEVVPVRTVAAILRRRVDGDAERGVLVA